MTDLAVPTPINEAAVLRALGIDAASPAGQATLLTAQRYGLDPLLKHLVIIGSKPYITRDGYLHVAHRSGQLDGIEVVDRGVDDTHYWATVSVHRKDMSRPFTYVGRYPKGGQQKAYGPEMAVKTAEVAALRRAFDVSGFAAVDEAWDDPEVEQSVAIDQQRSFVADLLRGLDEDQMGEYRAWCKTNNQTVSVSNMTAAQLEAVTAWINDDEDVAS